VYKGNSTIISLSHVLHIPSSRNNLVSQVQLDKHNICALLGKGRIELLKDNKVFSSGWVESDMYRLNVDIVDENEEPIINFVLDKKVGADFYTAYSAI
jgi:hypothetical protein